jgi:hypothetical protein
MSIDHSLDARMSRRLSAQGRALARLEKREAAADQMIGELCRNGQPVFYVFPVGGKYREGSRAELISYLIRNRHA